MGWSLDLVQKHAIVSDLGAPLFLALVQKMIQRFFFFFIFSYSSHDCAGGGEK